MTKSSDSHLGILGSLGISLSRISLISISPKVLSYETILLKTYYQIAATGDYRLLQIGGSKNSDACLFAWEEIVRRNGEENGNNRFEKYLDEYKTYALLINEYLTVKGALIKLMYKFDREWINYLNIKGYRIYTTVTEDKEKDAIKYTDSILSANKVADNLKTKIAIQGNSLMRYNKTTQGDKVVNLDQAVAVLSLDAGYSINADEIRLSTYNEMIKALKARRAESKRLRHGRGNT